MDPSKLVCSALIEELEQLRDEVRQSAEPLSEKTKQGASAVTVPTIRKQAIIPTSMELIRETRF